jgi:hypothetical protein
MNAKDEFAKTVYVFGMHGDLPALLDRHHNAIAVAPRTMTIREFEDTMYDLLEAMENAVEGNTIDLMEMATAEGREEVRDELGAWKDSALREVKHLQEVLSSKGLSSDPVAMEHVAFIRRMIEDVQKFLLPHHVWPVRLWTRCPPRCWSYYWPTQPSDPGVDGPSAPRSGQTPTSRGTGGPCTH